MSRAAIACYALKSRKSRSAFLFKGTVGLLRTAKVGLLSTAKVGLARTAMTQ